MFHGEGRAVERCGVEAVALIQRGVDAEADGI
jgi:hypothetical protein